MSPRTPRRPPRERPPEERSEEHAKRRNRAQSTGKPAGVLKPFVAGLGEILAILREMLRIPAELALSLAERLGLLILAAWRYLKPILLAALALARRGLAIAARWLTPARAVAAVLVAAAILLGVSQFLDYREVRAGVPDYAEVEQVAPAPQVTGSTRTAGSAHAYLLLAVALATIVLVVLSYRGRWRLSRMLLPLGLVTVAVAVLIDAPKGLDEGVIAIQFEGAEARLLAAFWVEVMTGVVIAVCGLLLAMQLRPESLRGRARQSKGSRGSALRSPVQGARS